MSNFQLPRFQLLVSTGADPPAAAEGAADGDQGSSSRGQSRAPPSPTAAVMRSGISLEDLESEMAADQRADASRNAADSDDDDEEPETASPTRAAHSPPEHAVSFPHSSAPGSRTSSRSASPLGARPTSAPTGPPSSADVNAAILEGLALFETMDPRDLQAAVAPSSSAPVTATPSIRGRSRSASASASASGALRASLDAPIITPEMAPDVRCWICYVDYVDSPTDRWVKPCKCKGSLGYTHEPCLLKFITSKDQDHPRCPQCQTPYRILSPANTALYFMYKVDNMLSASVPYVLFTGAGLAGLFLSTTYGVYALLTVAGPDAEEWLSNPEWGWRVWAGLPLIPVVLIFSRLEALDNVLPLLPLWLLNIKEVNLDWPPSPVATMVMLPWVRYVYSHAHKAFSESLLLPLLLDDEKDHLAPESLSATDRDAALARREQARIDLRLSERTDLGRLVVGALLAPALSASTGWLLAKVVPGFTKVAPTTFMRTVLGGCAFIACKDAVRLYYRYQKVLVSRRKRVVNYIG
ncbi:hypothetical protein H9P43_004757 [Blastocladiella emersonii ATCC 22665]|nr:hypothetical protein H9P43_004757 [Blastocladiella emersonii ATCC 22665]